MDKIIIKGMKFFAHHGLMAKEKKEGQDFIVDIRMNVDTIEAGKSDEIVDTVDYHAIYKRVKKVMEGESLNLLETLAARIAAEVLESPKVIDVTVRVRKPDPPISGEMRWVGVEVTRCRSKQK